MVKHKHDNDKIDLEYYKQKMLNYEAVFDLINEEFTDDMFGIYANSASPEVFQRNLMFRGWKYFDFKNLNEFFSIKY